MFFSVIAAEASLVSLVPGVDESPVVVGVDIRLIKLTWGSALHFNTTPEEAAGRTEEASPKRFILKLG